jgi:Domain of unknown function (DUF4214)
MIKKVTEQSLEKLYSRHKGKVSDKWFIYLSEYNRLFQPYRHDSVRLLEIGIQNGGSLDIWAKFFPNAQQILGCDINPDCGRLSYRDSRIGVVVGDANSDVAQSAVMAHSSEFELIIDDGSHKSGDILRSFARYFPCLADDGLFVVEDLHCSYWKEFEGGLFDPYSAMAFFKRLADVVSREHWGVEKLPSHVLAGFFARYDFQISDNILRHIHSIEFVNSMCIVRKCRPERNVLGPRFIAGSTGLVWSGYGGLHLKPGSVPNQMHNEWSVRTLSPEEELPIRLEELKARDVKIGNLGELIVSQEEQILALQQSVQDIEVLRITIAERDDKINKLDALIVENARDIAARDSREVSLNHALKGLESQILNLNQLGVEREVHIENLSQTVVDLEGQVTLYTQAVAESNVYISALNQTRAEREREISELNQTLAKRDDHIASLNQTISEQDESLTKSRLQLDVERKVRHQLEQDNARRQKALSSKANEAQRALDTLILEHAQLKQEGARELLALMQQGEHDRTQLARGQRESENKLRISHAEKERTFMLQLGAERKNSRALEQELRQHEMVSQDEITRLRIEVEQLRHVNQLEAQQYSYEINETKSERNLALKATHALEDRIFAEQQENTQLIQELNKLHHSVVKFQESFAWRALTPLRKIGLLGAPLADVQNGNLVITHDIFSRRRNSNAYNVSLTQRPHEGSFSPHILDSERGEKHYTLAESSVAIAPDPNSLTNVPKAVSNCDELMQYNGQKFIEATYLTLLGRPPDSDGMNFYLGRLNGVADKLQIAQEIFFSEECRNSGVELSGLRDAFSQKGITAPH